MEGIHKVSPPDQDDSNNPILEKKLLKKEGQYAALKTILGFNFDGVTKTLWLEEAKREKLPTTLHGWMRAAVWGIRNNTSKIVACVHSYPSRCGALVPM